MSNYSFKNNEINGDNIFGDVYGSSVEFIKENDSLNGDQVELVKMIFDRVENEIEKQKLLDSVNSISEGNVEDIGEENKGILKRFYSELISEGAKKSAELMCSALSNAPSIVHYIQTNIPQ